MADKYLARVDDVIKYLGGLEWQKSVQIFVEANCEKFLNTNEQVMSFSHDHYSIWESFQDIVEQILEVALQNMENTFEGGLKALESAIINVASQPALGPRDGRIKELLSQLLTYHDFSEFAAMMKSAAIVIHGYQIPESSNPQTLSLQETTHDQLVQMGYSSHLVDIVLNDEPNQSFSNLIEALEKLSKNSVTESRYIDYLQSFSSKYREEFDEYLTPDIMHQQFSSAKSIFETLNDGTTNEDIITLLKWASGMLCLEESILNLYKSRSPISQELLINYQLLVELKRSIDEETRCGIRALSMDEVVRMVTVNEIAAKGTTEEQWLHNLLIELDSTQREIVSVQQRIAVFIGSYKCISQNDLGDLHIYLKEKVTSGDDLVKIADEMLSMIHSVVTADHSSEVVKTLLDLHLLEEDQSSLRQQIMSIASSNPSVIDPEFQIMFEASPVLVSKKENLSPAEGTVDDSCALRNLKEKHEISCNMLRQLLQEEKQRRQRELKARLRHSNPKFSSLSRESDSCSESSGIDLNDLISESQLNSNHSIEESENVQIEEFEKICESIVKGFELKCESEIRTFKLVPLESEQDADSPLDILKIASSAIVERYQKEYRAFVVNQLDKRSNQAQKLRKAIEAKKLKMQALAEMSGLFFDQAILNSKQSRSKTLAFRNWLHARLSQMELCARSVEEIENSSVESEDDAINSILNFRSIALSDVQHKSSDRSSLTTAKNCIVSEYQNNSVNYINSLDASKLNAKARLENKLNRNKEFTSSAYALENESIRNDAYFTGLDKQPQMTFPLEIKTHDHDRAFKQALINAHSAKEKELIQSLHSEMLKKKISLEDRLVRKLENKKREKMQEAVDSSAEEKIINDSIYQLEKAFESVLVLLRNKNEKLGTFDIIGLTNAMDRIANGESLVDIPADSSSALDVNAIKYVLESSQQRVNSGLVSPTATIDRTYFEQEARRISSIAVEEQQKRDILLRLQQTREKQNLQRKLNERRSARLSTDLNFSNSVSPQTNASKGFESTELNSKQIERRDNLRSMQSRGMNLTPLRK